MNISCCVKIKYGRQFCRFQLFLNYDLTYREKYSIDLNEIWHTQVALIGNFKVNISIFEKIQYDRQFCRFRLFLNYDL